MNGGVLRRKLDRRRILANLNHFFMDDLDHLFFSERVRCYWFQAPFRGYARPGPSQRFRIDVGFKQPAVSRAELRVCSLR